MQVEALHGRDGMMALLRAFHEAADTFMLDVVVVVPVEGAMAYHLVYTIGDTRAAMTAREAEWFVDMLINHSGGMGPWSEELERFGRMMRQTLADVPGRHGVH